MQRTLSKIMCTFIKYVCSFIYAGAAVAEIYVQLKSSKNIYSADPFGINETQFFFRKQLSN